MVIVTTKRARELSRRTLDTRFHALIPVLSQTAMPHAGWVRSIRESLGMSAEALGIRLGVTKRSVQQLEEGEVSGSAQLSTLRRAAEALNCDLVHILVPRQPLEMMVARGAQQAARKITAGVSQTMALEAQAVETVDLTEVTAALVAHPSRIWNLPALNPGREV
jgi:predicted DNA-binding mobile mystery protein A